MKNGKKIIIFGNGGSAADAQHMSAEFIGRYLLERRSIPAITLTTDTSILTSIGNDYKFEDVFSRQCEALLEKEVQMKRLGNVEEVSNLVVFLSSDLSSFTTGATFVVDGGQVRSIF